MNDLVQYSIAEADRLAAIDGKRWVVTQRGAVVSTIKSASKVGAQITSGTVIYQTSEPTNDVPNGLMAMYLSLRINNSE
jgi:hypothetical protein